jgi:hypothetical protein
MMRAFLSPLVLAIGLVACGVLPSSYQLHVNNGTALTVRLLVNDRLVATIEPGGSASIPRADLPALPWTVEGRTRSGRLLAAMAVADGSVLDNRALDGTGEYSAPAAGVGLSCGTFSMYVGDLAPIGGGPTLGRPGDCEP